MRFISAKHPAGPINFNSPIGLTWRHVHQMVYQPLAFFSRLAEEYGELTFFRIFGHRGYFLNAPNLITQVLIHESDAFVKLPRQMNVIRQVLGDGILLTDGNRWKRERQHIQRALNSHMMARNADASVSVTEKMLTRWSNLSQSGGLIELEKEMALLTAGITSTVLVDENDPEILDSLARAMMFISDEFSHEMNSLIRFPDWMPFSRKKKKSKWIKFYNDLSKELILKRMKSNVHKEDFLGFLLSSRVPTGTDTEFVRDQLLTMLVAGYHATTMAMTWILHALETNPTVERNVLVELAQVEMNSKDKRAIYRQLPYLKYTVEETLRMYPPAWALFARKSIRPVQMNGYQIPAGGWFFISPFVTQRSERFFSKPLEFDPLRFSDDRRKQIPNGAYLPFGLGGHACIGARMAIEQLVLATATILSRFRVRREVSIQHPAMEAKLALRPKLTVRCQLTPSEIPDISKFAH